MAGVIQCHPRTVARLARRLNILIFHPSQNFVRIPDDQAKKLFAMTTPHQQAEFPFQQR